MKDKPCKGQGRDLALLLLAGLVVYANQFFVPFQFDDNLSIVDNPAIRHLNRLHEIWRFWPTRFVTYLSFAVNHHFHQLRVPGYHLVNVAIHLGAAILVWRIGLLMFVAPALKGQKITRLGRWASLLAGLVFVTHPLATQAVTYIVQRAASLAAFFTLASVYLYMRSRMRVAGGKFFFAGSLAAGALAMFSKEMAVTLPLLIWLCEVSFFQGDKPVNKAHLVPFFILALLVPLAMMLTGSVDMGEMRRTGERIAGLSPWEYFLTQGKVILTYIQLSLLPVGQNIDHDVSVARSFFEPWVWTGFFIIAGILVAAGRWFRGHRVLAFGIFWFFLTLLPESSVIPIRDVIFEHRIYLPLAGFSFFLAAAFGTLFEKRSLRMTILIGIILIGCFAGLAHARNAVWKSELSLWDDAARKSPQKARPFNNRGLAYAARGEMEKALADFTRAIELDPEFAEAYNNRGSVYSGQGANALALDDYNAAIARGPRYAEAYHNRGLVYAEKSAWGEAVSNYNLALRIRPGYAQAYYDRGNAYYAQGDFDRAILDYDRALEAKPDYAEAYHNRGSAFFSKGMPEAAARDYDAALAIKPDYAEARKNRALLRK